MISKMISQTSLYLIGCSILEATAASRLASDAVTYLKGFRLEQDSTCCLTKLKWKPRQFQIEDGMLTCFKKKWGRLQRKASSSHDSELPVSHNGNPMESTRCDLRVTTDSNSDHILTFTSRRIENEWKIRITDKDFVEWKAKLEEVGFTVPETRALYLYNSNYANNGQAQIHYKVDGQIVGKLCWMTEIPDCEGAKETATGKTIFNIRPAGISISPDFQGQGISSHMKAVQHLCYDMRFAGGVELCHRMHPGRSFKIHYIQGYRANVLDYELGKSKSQRDQFYDKHLQNPSKNNTDPMRWKDFYMGEQKENFKRDIRDRSINDEVNELIKTWMKAKSGKTLRDYIIHERRNGNIHNLHFTDEELNGEESEFRIAMDYGGKNAIDFWKGKGFQLDQHTETDFTLMRNGRGKQVDVYIINASSPIKNKDLNEMSGRWREETDSRAAASREAHAGALKAPPRAVLETSPCRVEPGVVKQPSSEEDDAGAASNI